MADVGAISELVNAQSLKLQLGSDKYIMLQELDFHLGRPEAREPTTDGGVLYFYGKGDHFFDATILLTNPEIKTFFDKNKLSTPASNLPEESWKILATSRGSPSTTVTITVKASIPEFNISKPVEGGVIFRVRFRILDDTPSDPVTT